MQWREMSARIKLAIYLFYRKIINLNQILRLIVSGKWFFYQIAESIGVNMETSQNIKRRRISRLKAHDETCCIKKKRS